MLKVWFSCGMQHRTVRGTGRYNRAESYFGNCLQALKESEIVWCLFFLINFLEHKSKMGYVSKGPQGALGWAGPRWASLPACEKGPQRPVQRLTCSMEFVISTGNWEFHQDKD